MPNVDQELPPDGVEVWATLDNGNRIKAYHWGDGWMVGVRDDPVDAPLADTVVSWEPQ